MGDIVVFIEACRSYLENLVTNLNPQLWGWYEWGLVGVIVLAILGLISSSIKAIIKAVAMVVAVLVIGVYFGYIKV